MLLSTSPSYNKTLNTKIKINKNFREVKDKLKDYYLNNGFKIKIVNENAGIKLIKNGSWVWFRQSKTEDEILRIIVDSKREQVSKSLLEEAKIILKLDI